MPDARDSVPAPSASRMKGPEAMVDIGSEEADKPSQQSHSGSEVHVGKQTTSRSGSNGSREAGRTPHQQLGRIKYPINTMHRLATKTTTTRNEDGSKQTDQRDR